MAILPLLFYFFFLLFIFTSTATAYNFSIAELDSKIRDSAFRELESLRERTGILYQVPLPAAANISSSGIKASAIRLRTGSFWSKGTSSTALRIPPRVTPIPYVERLLIIYQNLGNQSSSYFDVPGYSLISPVIGFLAYNASDTTDSRQLDLNATREHIVISFVPELKLPQGMNSSSTKCAKFGQVGSVQISDTDGRKSACSTKSTGHFAIILPSAVIPGTTAPPPEATGGKGGRSRWGIWVTFACAGGGVVGMALSGLVGLGIFKLIRNKKMVAMEGRSDEGEALRSVWVGGSKMPSALLMIRTMPVLETGD